MEKVLCLGNMTDRSTITYLNGLSEEFLAVKGEYDDPIIYLPNETTSSNKKPSQLLGANSAAPLARPNNGQITVGSLGHSTIGAAGNSGAAAFSGAAPPYVSNAPDGASLGSLDTKNNGVNGGSTLAGGSVSIEGRNKSANSLQNATSGTAGSSVASQGTAVTLPLSRVVTIGNLRIGFNSGHTLVPNSDPDALLIAARQLDVDIFIWGGTHRVEAYQLEGKFFVNPGSATGAFYTGWPYQDELSEGDEDEENEDKQKGQEDGDKEKENKTEETKLEAKDGENGKAEGVDEPKDPIPSFCLFDVQDSGCVVYIYRYIDGEVKVDKINYQKEQDDK